MDSNLDDLVSVLRDVRNLLSDQVQLLRVIAASFVDEDEEEELDPAQPDLFLGYPRERNQLEEL